MSSIVSYKGSPITTVSNETKTLTTKGTWLEDDIVIVDTTSGGSGIDIPVFTVTFDSNWEEVQSVTCNKTFSECLALYEDD